MSRRTAVRGPGTALGAALVGVLLLGPPLRAGEPPGPAAAPPYEEALAPFVAAWCVRCHQGAKPPAGLDLARWRSTDDVRAAPALAALVRRRVARGEMPPPGGERPPRAEVEAALAWLDAVTPPAMHPGPPGQVTARRLNRAEYENAVRDLLALRFAADETFPADDVGHGFDNVGDVLAMPPVLLERYLLAAERIADDAVVDTGGWQPPVEHREGEGLEVDGGGRLRGDGAWLLFSRGEVRGTFAFPRAGAYRVRVRTFGQQAGPEPARVQVRAGDEVLATLDVEATEGDPQVLELPLVTEAGARVVGAAFVNDYYRPEEADPTQRDRNLGIVFLEVEGPAEPPSPPPAQARLLPPRGPGEDEASWFRGCVAAWARRAWRRPPEDEDVDRLVALAAGAAGEDATPEARMRAVLVATLVSPRFLFRVEPPPAPGEASRALDDHEVATRLAAFLWASVPDDRLLDLADAGLLLDPPTLDAEVDRMLADARAWALSEHFAAQWLGLRDLTARVPDPERFPGVDAALLGSMRMETLLLFDAVLREHRDVRELLDADFTFLDERLAEHYGLPGVRGPLLRRVPLGGLRPGGILAHASVLTATSNPTRTSPVKRGKWVLERLLDAPPPPPPPGVGVLDESPEAARAATLRERLAQHRADPACAVCHERMDALGIALEHFDAVGRWRDREDGHPVDAAATLPDGRTIDGAADLAATVREDPAFFHALAHHLLVWALGRGVVPEDEGTVQVLVAALEEEPTLDRLVHAIVRSYAFLRRGAPPTDPGTESDE